MSKVLRKVSDFNPENTLLGAIRTFIASQMVSSSDLKEIRDVFNALDANGDGKLSREELLEGFAKIYGKDCEEYVDRIMELADVDCSGFIDYTEFIRVTMDKEALLSDKNLKSAFDMFDDDGNGKISALELKDCLLYTSPSPRDS